MPEKLKTYIKGLDNVLDGGIPKNHLVLFAGQPGTMKSSLAYSILYNNAKKNGLSGIHISLEQSRESLVENMTGLGFAIDKELNKKLSILDLGFIRKKMTQLGTQTWLEVFKMYTQNLKNNMNYDLMVIDSLPVLEVMARFKEPREELFHLFEWMRDLDVTVFLIHEMEAGEQRLCKYGEDFLSDGILHLDLRRDRNQVNLFLAVNKMRKSNHKRGYFPLIFDKNGFEIVTD